MLPALGLMIGSYIVTRMASIILGEDEHPVVKGLAIATAIITIVMLYDILTVGMSLNDITGL